MSLHAETMISTIPKSRDDQREENQGIATGLPVAISWSIMGISQSIFFEIATGLPVFLILDLDEGMEI